MEYPKIRDYPQHKKIFKKLTYGFEIYHVALGNTFLIMFLLKTTLVIFSVMMVDICLGFDFDAIFKKPIKHQLWFFLRSLLTSFFFFSSIC